MDKAEIKRNSSMDIIRCIALFLVISVHFFLHNEYYFQPVEGIYMYIMTLMRSCFMECVPLFMVLTGYLMNKKKPTRSYYKGIKRIVLIYLYASAACLIFQSFYLKQTVTFYDIIFKILDFSGAPYSWYVEMYIGLFMLIPFLNSCYWGLQSKRHKQLLIVTMVLLTALPSVLNIYNFFVDGWWRQPALAMQYNKLIPAWWAGMYPLTYYFFGAYINEYPPKIKISTNLFLWLGAVLLAGTFNFWRSHGETFVWGAWSDWGSLFNVIMTVLLFVLLSNIKYIDKKNFLQRISNLCYGAYLVSAIFDQLFYPFLIELVPNMLHRLYYYPIIVPMIFVCSLLLSYILSILYKPFIQEK